jgi:hypothetical protein
MDLHQKTRLLVLLAILILWTQNIFSQQLLGIVNSNFAGSNSTLINPSALNSSKLYMDINLVTFNQFLGNDYLYIRGEDYSFFNFLSRDPELPSYGPDDMPFDRYTNTRNKNVFIQTLVRGPAFFQNRGRHAYSLYTGVRLLSSARHVPYELGNFGYYGLDYEEQHNILYDDYDFYTNALAFIEVGATYSFSVLKYGFDDLSVGMTLKALFGYTGAYAYIDNVNYMIPNDSIVDIRNMRLDAGYSLPVDYDNNDFPDNSGFIKGNGVGFDIGATYQRKVRTYQKRRVNKLCRQKYVDYRYKIGVSLLDLGYVRFTKNTQLHAFDDVSEYWINADTLSYYNFNQLIREFSNVFYDDPDASYRGDVMTMLLPAAFSIQADYHYYRNWYFNATLVQPIEFGRSMVTRPAQLSVTPRYETPTFEASLPISLYEWRYPRIGLALRYQFFTIGTDKLGGFVGITDFTGLDIYFSIKLNFSKGNCKFFNRFTPCQNNEYGPRWK